MESSFNLPFVHKLEIDVISLAEKHNLLRSERTFYTVYIHVTLSLFNVDTPLRSLQHAGR